MRLSLNCEWKKFLSFIKNGWALTNRPENICSEYLEIDQVRTKETYKQANKDKRNKKAVKKPRHKAKKLKKT